LLFARLSTSCWSAMVLLHCALVHNLLIFHINNKTNKEICHNFLVKKMPYFWQKCHIFDKKCHIFDKKCHIFDKKWIFFI
jgi:hypothetical protein